MLYMSLQGRENITERHGKIGRTRGWEDWNEDGVFWAQQDNYEIQ